MEVSVVVPVLNEAHTIGSLIEALLRQTRPPTEIVVADGGSVDGTRSILSDFAAAHPPTREGIEDSLRDVTTAMLEPPIANFGVKGIRVNSCFGSARFRRWAQDQDFIEELREAHPAYYLVWLLLTDCGRSMLLVVGWCLAIAILFGFVYYGLGEQAFAITNKETLNWSVFTSIYYSVVTFTPLGFGDITPRTPIAAAAVMLEVVVGYMMLGILISILATKVARRS